MRYFEIILKLAFLAGSIYLFITKAASAPCLNIFLAVSFVLGLVLIFNKEASYNFRQTKRDLLLRRIEGIVLVVFSAVIYLSIYA